MTFIFSLIGIIASFFVISCQKKNTNILEATYKAITLYLFAYTSSTVLLLSLNSFSLKKASMLGMIVCICALIFLLIKGNKPSWDFDVKKYIVPILVSALILPITSLVPFEYFAMGQDEGVYQTEAILYLRGKTSDVLYYPEYDISPTIEEKDAFQEAVMAPNVLGTYDLSVVENGISTDNGLFSIVHGLHTFSAVMALWASVFGISQMNGVNALILILCVFWLWEVLELIKINFVCKVIAQLIFGLSPIVIWVTKSALTEIGLTLIWIVFIYYLLRGRKHDKLLAGLSAGFYGFWHVSAYVFVPLFLFLLIAIYLYTSDKSYLKAGLVYNALFFLSFIYSLKTAKYYLYKNLRILSLPFVSTGNVLLLVACFMVLASIVMVILLMIKPLHVKFNTTIISILVKVTFAICGCKYIHYIIKSCPTSSDVKVTTMIAYFVLTGFVFLLLTCIFVLGPTTKLIQEKTGLILVALFLYCIPVYGTFLRPSIVYYYYYSRYIAMYILVIALAGAYALDKICGKKFIIPLIAGILSISYLVPHDIYLSTLKDDSRIEWSTLTDLEETLVATNTEAVFLSPSLYYIAYYDLYSMGIRVYPIYDNFDECAPDIAQYYNNICIIDDGSHPDITGTRPLISKIINTGRENNGRAEDWLRMPHDCDEYYYPVISTYLYEK